MFYVDGTPGGQNLKTTEYQWYVPGIKISVLSVFIFDEEVGGTITYTAKTEFASGGIDQGGDGNGGNGDDEEPYDPEGVWLNAMSAGGEFFQKVIGSLSWTMGEAITETMEANSILTQGFNQPGEVVVSANKLEEIQVKVYPNPFTSEITINIANCIEELDAALYSTTGQIVRNFKLNNPVNCLYLNECKPGMYYLRINNPENPQTFKIIKK
jgi:hypothetical protein